MVAAPITPIEADPQAELLPVRPVGVVSRSGARGAAADLAAQVYRLPLAADDLSRDLGLDIYDRMALDPQIHAGRRILVTAALNQPVQLSIPVPRQDESGQPNPTYATASRYAAFVREAFRRLPIPLEATLFEMATGALTHGHSLAEKIEAPPVAVLPGSGPQRVLADIKPRPLGSYGFAQDAFANTRGVVPLQSGMSWMGTLFYSDGLTVIGTTGAGGTVVGDIPVYDMDHFAVLTWNGKYRDPRGQSLLRAAYGAWTKKRQAEPGLLAYLARFGQPSLSVTMPPNVPDQAPLPDGTFVKTTDLYTTTAEAYQAGGISVWPNGTVATLEEAKGDGAAYIQAEALWNREISMALLGQTLATNEAQHESRAAATVHQDILALLIRYIKFWLADFVYHQLIVPLVLINFGADAVPMAPTVSLGQTDPENLAAVANAIAQMTSAGYWDATKMPPDIGAQLDVRLNFPERQVSAVNPDGTPADAPPTVPQTTDPVDATAPVAPEGGNG